MQTSHPEIYYWLAATRLAGIGPVTVKRWLEQVGDIKTLFSASMSQLKLLGLTESQMQEVKNPRWHAVARDIAWCEKNHCHLISLIDPRYPLLLKEIFDAPLVLYVRGECNLLSHPQLAMVGSRNATATGIKIAKEFAYSLTEAGLIITSGLALGIDGASHKGALAAKGKTIAVLGTGLAHIYPKSHEQLANEIAASGALISEFSPLEPPKAINFPRRNRIISGLSLGVLVVEAVQRSGSLITARFAIEQGREVFAIPGSIHNPFSRGCHQLLRQGAKLVETADDILEELGALHAVLTKTELPAPSLPDNPLKLNGKYANLIAHIGYEITPLDAIIIQSGLTTGQVSSMLLSLELEGHIQAVAGGYVRIANKR